MEIIEAQPRVNSTARLVGYLHSGDGPEKDGMKRPCVVVCPGGGYAAHAPHEAEPVALWFFSLGYQAFVLYYTIAGANQTGSLRWEPLKDLSAAVCAIRANSAAWRTDGKVAVCGFSAGGHLAASLGTQWKDKTLCGPADSEGANRPDAMVLCYPVISAKVPGTHGSIEKLAGNDVAKSRFSLEDCVDAVTPPTFIWHTADDQAVDVKHTLLFVDALRHHQIPFECHIFEHGKHGLSLCVGETTEDRRCAAWVSLCVAWLGGIMC